MNNRAVFLVSGFSRGGTNILWNLICSHPDVLSTGLELNEILGPRRSNITLGWKAVVEAFAIPNLPVPKFLADYTGARVINFAEEHAKSSWGRWKEPEQIYTDSEIERLPVCTKSVNSWARDDLFALLRRNIALKYNNLLLKSFGEVKTIYLIRDSESQCNGWMRRGCDPYEAGKWYRKIVNTMLDDYMERKNHVLLVRFSDVLSDPLSTINRVYKFLGLECIELSNFHLKSKKILKADGSHEVLNGKEGEMVWVPRTELGTFLDPEVDKRQKESLSSESRSQFHRGLGNIVERLDELFI